MKKLLFLTILAITSLSLAQEKIEYIPIANINADVAKNAETGDFDKSIELLNKVSKNDSSYCATLTTKSYYLLQAKKYDDVIRVANNGINEQCVGYENYFYINKSVALLNQEKYNDALIVLNEGIKTFPYSTKLWYNKAVTFERLNKIEEAIKAYQTTILLNPSYAKPHLQLGNICYKQQQMAQALMCFNMYLLLELDNESAFSVLKSLNNVVSAFNKNVANPDVKISEDDAAFEDLNLILDQKVALNDNYSTGNKIDIALVKQNHALLTQLKNFEGDNGFWNMKYIPFYQWVMANNYFDDFTYTLAFSIENENYKKIIEKNNDKVTAFYGASTSKWKEIVRENDVLIDGKKEKITYLYGDQYINGVGKIKDEKNVGNWKFYNENGRLKSEAEFNVIGERHGSSSWYFPNGKVKETAVYKKGKLEGQNIHYYKNGIVNLTCDFVNDKLEGEYRYYNDKGALEHKKYYKDGELDGLYEAYFKIGEDLVEFSIPYAKGLINGHFKEYYANGNVYSEVDYIQGKKNGLVKKYHVNGNLSSESTYANGNLEGTYKNYFINKALQEQGQLKQDVYVGPVKFFYKDGTLKSEYTYDNGKLNGLYTYNDHDGKKYYEYNYRKGEIISYTYFDKEGAIIKENKKKGGEFQYYGYTPEGNLTSEGLYDVKGGKKGLWKFNTENGVLSSQGNYNDDKAEGIYTSYYPNGKTKSIANYKTDILEGYFVEYHKNEKIKSQGWYQEGLKQGEWRNYYMDGTLSDIVYYHKGKVNGTSKSFGEDGKTVAIYTFEFDTLLTESIFDNEGNLFQVINHEKTEDNYVLNLKHFNNEISSKIHMKYGIKHGAYEKYYFGGTKEIIGEYLNDVLHGHVKIYHENGKISSEGEYKNGVLHGKWVDYYDTGDVSRTYEFEYGRSKGTWLGYHENGKLSTSTEYDNDENHGRKEFYSPEGNLQLIRFYSHGRLIGYSHLDSNSKELPMIELVNETGTIKATYDNGNVSRVMEYKKGQLVGIYKSYYYSGQLESQMPYLGGEYNGTNIEYYADGKIKKQTEYLFGNIHGQEKEFHANGNPKSEITYLNDSKSGDANYYDQTGKLIKTNSYFNGDVFASKTY